jgi:BlaI family transcriptional regulator, penicillinase repressor
MDKNKIRNNMKEKKELRLTKAEEQIMQIMWEMEKGLVKEVRNRFPDPKPSRNTVSTVIRILEKKGYMDHKAHGNTHIYYPIVKKEEYSRSQFFGLMENYFNNSFPAMASLFAREKDMSVDELNKLLKELRKELKNINEND